VLSELNIWFTRIVKSINNQQVSLLGGIGDNLLQTRHSLHGFLGFQVYKDGEKD